MKRIGIEALPSRNIEALLAWAFGEELPKAQIDAQPQGGVAPAGTLRSGWDVFRDLADFGTVIDRRNGFGCVPLVTGDDPHPDALLVGRTVLALRPIVFDVPEGYDLVSDLRLVDGSTLTDAERVDAMDRGLAMVRADAESGRGRMAGIVCRTAMTGRGPGWSDIGRLERKPVRNASGGVAWFRKAMRSDGEGRPDHEIEIDGFDRVRRRPYPGAYQKTRLVPDPAGLVAERAEYQAYVLTLAHLAAELDGRLASCRVTGPDLSLWPWEADERSGAPRVEFSGDPADHPQAARCAVG